MTKTDERRSLPHEPGLDGVRGLAVGGVLLFHAGHLRGGFLGVDAFFVLSGYLITTLLLREIERTTTLDFWHFYARRLRRLMPAVVLVMAFVAVYAKFIAAPSELSTIRGDGIATLLYSANWRAISAGRDYWALFRSPSPLEHTWSLAIEEQFYLVWPFVMWVVARGSWLSTVVRVRLVACIGVALSSGAMYALFVELHNERSYFGTDTRISSMFVGAILATLAIPSRMSKLHRAMFELAALISVLFLGWLWIHAWGTDSWLYRGGLLLQAIAVALVLVAVVHPTRGPLFWLIQARPLRALGVISYGVYLWHWPIYVWLNGQRVGHGGWWLLIVRVGVTIGVATISYWCVERPIRRGAFAQIWVWIGVPTGIIASAIVIVLATAGDVSPARGSEVPDPIPLKPVEVAPRSNRPQRILVVGNSIGYYLAADGFSKPRTDDDPFVLNRSVIGCHLLREAKQGKSGNGAFAVEGPACIDGDWSAAITSWKPDVVLRVMSSASDEQLKLDGEFVDACGPPYQRLADQTLRDEAQVLTAGGADVVFVTAATPAYPFLSERWFAADKCLNDLVRRVAASAPHTKLADLQRFMCEREFEGCRLDVHGVVMRSDLVHYRDEGARIAMQWILTHAVRA